MMTEHVICEHGHLSEIAGDRLIRYPRFTGPDRYGYAFWCEGCGGRARGTKASRVETTHLSVADVAELLGLSRRTVETALLRQRKGQGGGSVPPPAGYWPGGEPGPGSRPYWTRDQFEDAKLR